MFGQAGKQLTGGNDLNNSQNGQVSQWHTCDLDKLSVHID